MNDYESARPSLLMTGGDEVRQRECFLLFSLIKLGLHAVNYSHSFLESGPLVSKLEAEKSSS